MARERNKPVSFRDLDAEDWKATQHYDWCELKYDGHFARIEIGTERSARKRWRVYSSTDRLVEDVELPAGIEPTVLWAEHIRGTEWACKPERADLYEHFAVFASPQLDGKVQPFPHSAVTRRDIARWLKRHTAFDRFFLVDRADVSKAPALWKRHVATGDFEGLIFGGAHGLARMKATASYDYVCLGFETSDSDRFSGWGIRSVIGGLYDGGTLKRVTTVGGLTDQQRAEFYQHADRYVGRVFEAEGKRLFDNGKLRHPNFRRWRDDKNPSACIPPKR